MSSILKLKNIYTTKTNNIIKNINLTIYPDEIAVIVGKRDSGTSVLSRIIYGMSHNYTGDIFILNKKIQKLTPKKAIRLGISAIFSESGLIDNLNIIENYTISNNIKILLPSIKKAKKKILDIFNHLKLSFNLDEKIYKYNRVDRLFLELGKVFYFSPKLLIFNYPTDRLNTDEIEKLYFLLSLLRDKGISILYFATEIDNKISKFASKIFILDDGKIIDVTKQLVQYEINKEDFVKNYFSSLISRSTLEEHNNQLFEENIFMSTILENIDIPMLVTNSMFKIIFVNKYFLYKINLSKDTISGKNIVDLLDIKKLNIDLNNLFEKVNYRTIKDVKPSIFPDEKECHIEIISLTNKYFKYADNTGNILFLFMNGKKYNINKKYSEYNDIFIQKLNHEISNSSNIILNYLKLLEKSTEEEIHKRSHICQIENEILRLQKAIINFIQLYTDNKKLNIRVDIRQLMKTLLDKIEPYVNEKNIKCEIKYPFKKIYSLNYILIMQVLYNISINSIEAMESGGLLEIDCYNLKNILNITIIDNGSGINQKNIKKVFDPFFSTKHKNTNNKGLGLSIVKDIMLKINGTIEIISKIGVGTKIILSIPY